MKKEIKETAQEIVDKVNDTDEKIKEAISTEKKNFFEKTPKNISPIIKPIALLAITTILSTAAGVTKSVSSSISKNKETVIIVKEKEVPTPSSSTESSTSTKDTSSTTDTTTTTETTDSTSSTSSTTSDSSTEQTQQTREQGPKETPSSSRPTTESTKDSQTTETTESQPSADMLDEENQNNLNVQPKNNERSVRNDSRTN